MIIGELTIEYSKGWLDIISSYTINRFYALFIQSVLENVICKIG